MIMCLHIHVVKRDEERLYLKNENCFANTFTMRLMSFFVAGRKVEDIAMQIPFRIKSVNMI